MHISQVSKNLSPFSGELSFQCEGVPVDGKDLAAKFEGKDVKVTHV